MAVLAVYVLDVGFEVLDLGGEDHEGFVVEGGEGGYALREAAIRQLELGGL